MKPDPRAVAALKQALDTFDYQADFPSNVLEALPAGWVMTDATGLALALEKVVFDPVVGLRRLLTYQEAASAIIGAMEGDS